MKHLTVALSLVGALLALPGQALAQSPPAASGTSGSANTPSPKATSPAAQGAWAKTGPLTTPRSFHSATLLKNGKVLVAGGCDVYGGLVKSCTTATASAELYDPSLGKWRATGQMKTARMGHTATLLPNGKVLVAGGCTEPQPSGAFKCKKSTAESELYDPATGRWSGTGSMKFSRTVHAATLIPTGPATSCAPNCGKVLVVGNSLETFNGFTTVAAELYDSASGTWTETGTPPQQPACCLVSTALLKGQRVLMINQALGSAAIFNPKQGAWTEAAPDPIARGAVGVSVLTDGRVLASGGFTQDTKGDGAPSAEIFDAGGTGSGGSPSTSGSWTPAGRMITGRAAHASIQLGGGRVLVAGEGIDPELLTAAQNGSPSAVPGPILIKSTETFDERTGRWTSAGEMSEGRGVTTLDDTRPNSFSATLLKDGRVLIVGGESIASFNKARPLNLQDKLALASADIYTPADLKSPGIGAAKKSADSPKGNQPRLLWAAALAVALTTGAAVIARRRRGKR